MKRDFYWDVYTILNQILINNMDQMRISGNEPSSVILSQTKKLKSWSNTPKVPNQAKAKGGRLDV